MRRADVISVAYATDLTSQFPYGTPVSFALAYLVPCRRFVVPEKISRENFKGYHTAAVKGSKGNIRRGRSLLTS